VQSDGAGTLYRLSAKFAISGPGGVMTVDADGDAPSVVLALPPGEYTVEVLDGWHLERSVNGEAFEPIDAQLGTMNPAPVTITPGGSATVVFFFLIGVGNHGTLTITFFVAPLHARVVGTLHATDATGMLAGYLDHPPTFVISYALTAETTVNVPPRYHQGLSVFDELRFTDDPLGLLASPRPVSGGSLDYKIEVEPDDSQVLLLTYGAPSAGGLQFLSASAIPLVPKLPIDELGVPADPGRVGLSGAALFTLSAGDLGSMSGTLDFQFMPKG
jgi:hypothetical protein